MIALHSNAAHEAQILFRFANGWTASVLPNADGSIHVAAWASQADAPTFGQVRVVGADIRGADDVNQFLCEIASAGKVKS